MIIVIGEILFDLFPTGKRIGGASFNFAFHLKNLGFPVRFISRVGNDLHGKEILDFLEQNNFNTDDIQRDTDHATGTVKIAMDGDGNHTFSIISDTAYDHIVFNTRTQKLSSRPWDIFYFGTLIQRTLNGAGLVQQVLSRKQDSARGFCDINLRPGCYTHTSLRASLKGADILKLNQEELDEIWGRQKQGHTTEEHVTRLMQAHCLELVILTLGKQGSRWFTKKACHSALAKKVLPVIDTVGAGDAYAAMAVAGRLSHIPDDKAMVLAGEFAGRICGFKGALPDSRNIYKDFSRRLKI